MKSKPTITRKSAFTLIELLVVIAIISLLVSILLPSLARARDLARKAVCSSNLHQMSLIMEMYKADYEIVPIYYVWADGYIEDHSILLCPSDEFKGLYKNSSTTWKLDIPYDPMSSGKGSSYWRLPLFYAWWRGRPDIATAMCKEISGVPVTRDEICRTPYENTEYLTHLRCIQRHDDVPYALHLLGGGGVIDYYPQIDPTTVWSDPEWYTNCGMGG